MSSAPLVIRTASGAHSVNALTGPADQLRHELQWQNPIAAGAPVTVISTAPQKQLPLYVSLVMAAIGQQSPCRTQHRESPRTAALATRCSGGPAAYRLLPLARGARRWRARPPTRRRWWCSAGASSSRLSRLDAANRRPVAANRASRLSFEVGIRVLRHWLSTIDHTAQHS